MDNSPVVLTNCLLLTVHCFQFKRLASPHFLCYSIVNPAVRVMYFMR